MKRFLKTLIVVIANITAFFILYKVLLRLLERLVLKTRPNGLQSPASLGLEYEDIHFLSGKRHLQAWFLPAVPASGPKKAVLIYHGVYESISEWVPVMDYFDKYGISCMVFDYSGFGSSEGNATLEHLREDALAAYQIFLSRVDPSVELYALGFSLGTGVLLEAVPRFPYPLNGLILIEAFSSFRDIASKMKALPSWLTFILPDVYNNVWAVQHINTPLLLVHSQDDQLSPLSMAEKIYTAAHEPKRLVVLEGLRHNDILEGKAGEFLYPVIDYLDSHNINKTV